MYQLCRLNISVTSTSTIYLMYCRQLVTVLVEVGWLHITNFGKGKGVLVDSRGLKKSNIFVSFRYLQFDFSSFSEILGLLLENVFSKFVYILPEFDSAHVQADAT